MATVTTPKLTADDAKAVYDARFTEKLSWNEMRAKFGVKYNSTRFYALMVPHVVTKAGKPKAQFKQVIEASEALARAIERKAAV
jgi:hypothetical protein